MRGPRDEVTPGLVDDKGAVAGDSSKIATGGTSADILGAGETDTSRNGSEITVGGRDDSTAATEQNKRKLEKECQNCETSSEGAKKLKTSSHEEDAPGQKNCEFSVVESSNTSNVDASVTEEVDKTGTGVPGPEAETREESFGSLKLAVVLEGFPESKMTRKQAEMVESALVARMDQTDRRGEPIQFSATEYVNGALVLTCDNRTTETWLYKNARRLVPWRGARLTVGHEETTLNGIRLEMWMVAHMSKRSDEQILDLLQKQNKGLSTVEWKIFSREAESDKTVRLSLWVDNESYSELKARDFLLFLGLGQSNFLSSSEWNKLKSSSTKELAPPSLLDLPTNYPLLRPQRPRRPTASYTPPKPVSPWLVPPRNLSQSIPAPSSVSWAVPPSQGPWLPDMDPSRQYQPQSQATDPTYFHKGQLTSSDLLLTRESTENSQYSTSGFWASEKFGDLGFSMLQGSQSGEVGQILSDRPHQNRYLASDLRETEYGGPEALQLLYARYTVSDRVPIRDSGYLSPNRDKSEDSRFGSSNRLPSLVSRYGKLSDPFTETDIQQNVTSTIRDHGFQKSELRQLQEASVSDRARRRERRYSSERPRENEYLPSESRRSLETDHRVPYPPPLLGTNHTASIQAPSRNSKSVTADRNKSRDSRYVTPKPDRSENTRFGGSGELPSRVSRFCDTDKRLTETDTLPSLASAFLSSKEPDVRGLSLSDLPQSQEASYRVSDRARHREPRYTSDRLQDSKNFTSDSQWALETVYGAPDLLQLRETSYKTLDRAPSRDFESVTANRNKSQDSRYMPPNRDESDDVVFRGSDRLLSRVSRFGDVSEPLAETATMQNFASTLRTSEQPHERGFRMSELSPSREASHSVVDRARHRDSRYSSDRHWDEKYLTSDRHRKSPDPEYVAPNRDRSENRRVGGSDRLLRGASRFSELDEPLIKTTPLQSLVSTLLTSEQSREHGFGMSEPSQSREATYGVLDRAQRRESRYTLDRHQNNKCLPSDSSQPLETVRGVLDPPHLRAIRYTDSDRALSRDSKSVTAERDRSRDSRYVAPKQEHSIEKKFRDSNLPLSSDSRFRNLDELPVWESRYRSSEKLQSREGRFEKEEYFIESRSTLTDFQKYREFGEDESPVWESRFRSSDKLQAVGSRFEEREYSRDSKSRLPDSQQYREFYMDKSPLQESRFRGSDERRSREGRVEERDYPHESRLRVLDSQQYRESDNSVSYKHSRKDRISSSPRRSRSPHSGPRHSHKHSHKDRISGSDISPRQSRSPRRSHRHSHTSRSVDSQHYREFDNSVSHKHSYKDRISSSDISPRQSRSPHGYPRHPYI